MSLIYKQKLISFGIEEFGFMKLGLIFIGLRQEDFLKSKTDSG
jgi:hypothetical protein